MRQKSKVVKISLVLCVLGGLAIASILWHGISPEGKGSSRMGIFLAKPAFAQEDGVSFLEREAGISAYMNAGRSIDLAMAKSAFRTVERETDEYIIGSVPLSGYPETEDVHAYAHKDGWIATYYIKDEPAAKILDWNDYGQDGKIRGTKLEIGIIAICNAASVPTKDVKYYDFRYPDTNKMMIAAEAMWSSGRGEETFSIKLPSDFVFYERSYSLLGDSIGTEGSCTMYLDEKEISRIRRDNTQYGVLSPTQLSFDVLHTVKISQNYNNNKSFVAIVLIYREP